MFISDDGAGGGASLQSENGRHNIHSFRGFNEKFCPFGDCREALIILDGEGLSFDECGGRASRRIEKDR